MTGKHRVSGLYGYLYSLFGREREDRPEVGEEKAQWWSITLKVVRAADRRLTPSWTNLTGFRSGNDAAATRAFSVLRLTNSLALSLEPIANSYDQRDPESLCANMLSTAEYM